MAFQDPFSSPQQQAYGAREAVGFDAGLRAYMLRIYNYMASALALTGIVALVVANSPAILSLFVSVEAGRAGLTGLGWVVLVAPFFLVLGLGFRLERMSVTTAQAMYWAFAVLIGISMAPIFLVYTGASVARTFFVTAGTFGAMSLYGYTTKKDLSGMGSFLFMGLIGLIIASFVSYIFPSPGFNFALSVIGVIIFTGLTAWDTQKLKALYYQMGAGGEMLAKVSILGALNLYLDFINMFQFLLRFMGNQRQ